MSNYADKVTRLTDVLKSEKALGRIMTEGLLLSAEEKATSTGKPYVQGFIGNKQYRMMFRMWDIGLEGFLKDVPNEEAVVRLVGNHEIYNETPQLIVESVIMSETPVDEFVRHSAVSPDAMRKAVNGLTEGWVREGNCEVLTYVCGFMMDYCGHYNGLEPLTFFPYGRTVHTEKGGLLQHIYNVVGTLTPVGLPKRADGSCAVNLAVCAAAAICYRVWIFDYMDVSPVTGSIRKADDRRYALDGKTRAVTLLTDCVRVYCGDESFKGGNSFRSPYLENLRHCVCALNGLVEPVTPEAVLICSRVKAELDMARATEAITNGEKSFINVESLPVREETFSGCFSKELRNDGGFFYI